jgi:peptidylprolyl isomerase
MAKLVEKTEGNNPYVFIDIDIDDNRASYARAVDFVDKNSIKYGLSSNVLSELGGREKISIKELVANDFAYADKGRVQSNPQKGCRLVFELFPTDSPLAVENMIGLCTGSHGKSKSSGLPLHYKGCKMHRYIPNFVLQGGDFVFENGTGGESIFGKKFKDDQKGLKLKHNKRGVLSMGNSGKNSNTSQFFVTLGENAKGCDGKHVVMGQMIHGFHVFDMIENMRNKRGLPLNSDETPPISLTITESGIWRKDIDLIDGFWNAKDVFEPLPILREKS